LEDGTFSVGIASESADPTKATMLWQVDDLDVERRSVRLRLKPGGQDSNLFLNGMTVNGNVTLEADERLSGTRWEIASVGDPAEGLTPPPHPDM